MKKYYSCYESPSNIAIVKYWGKTGNQLPLNPSMSFTLSKSKTIMEIELIENDTLEVEFLFNNSENLNFKNKIFNKLKLLTIYFPWISKSKFKIRSKNTFPHSAGIASSASSMSALSLNLVDINSQINPSLPIDLHLASEVSRILSGSASRSIFPIASTWGESNECEDLSNFHATDLSNSIHEKFKTLKDAILIVEDKEKIVSSSAGHELMNNHPHLKSRILHANSNFTKLISILKNGDFEEFSKVAEREALDLHSMMMTSDPSFILLSPESLNIILKIREFKKVSKCNLTFTIDAGPNIHLLYLLKDKIEVESFINEAFIKTNIVKNVIWDEVGNGPKAVSYE